MAHITRCPVAVNKTGPYKPCDEEIQASRVEWFIATVIDDDGNIVDWGEHYGNSEHGEEQSRYYCANDHTEAEVINALHWLKEAAS